MTDVRPAAYPPHPKVRETVGVGREMVGARLSREMGFQQQGRRRGKQGKGFKGPKGGSSGEGGQGGGGLAGKGGSGVPSSKGSAAGGVEALLELLSGSGSREGTPGSFSSQDVGGKDWVGGGGCEESSGSVYGNRFSVLRHFSLDAEGSSTGNFTRNSNNQPRYLKMLPNGDFDPEAYEDEKDWEDEEDMENEDKILEQLVEKRGVSQGSDMMVEENAPKKGRMSLEVSSEIVPYVA
ncbi:PE-PGRS family protein PE_PGRS16-like [Salvia splendens]|uniref:PE-PGRS family protein PE_PGRS16-like n=1 Tax=Salvia splendens TaxID=180675 RepID=UPI001C25696F|nr:PE-PGRS family protein PE_PGRS16-like [Salvia splendens]